MAHKAKRHGFGVSFLLSFLLFGGVFGAMGIVGFQSLTIDESWKQTAGIVTDVSSHKGKNGMLYAPVVTYEVDGRSYEITSRSSSSAYPTLGDAREVAYNPARPDQAKLIEGVTIKLLFLVFLLIGLVGIISGPLLFVRSLKRSKTITRLETSGQKITGVIVDVVKTGRSNKKSLYKIAVSAQDPSSGVRTYTSDTLSDVEGLLLVDFQQTPIPVDVYIDPANHDQYYVDISDIPGLSPERIRSLIEMSQKKFGVHPKE